MTDVSWPKELQNEKNSQTTNTSATSNVCRCYWGLYNKTMAASRYKISIPCLEMAKSDDLWGHIRE